MLVKVRLQNIPVEPQFPVLVMKDEIHFWDWFLHRALGIECVAVQDVLWWPTRPNACCSQCNECSTLVRHLCCFWYSISQQELHKKLFINAFVKMTDMKITYATRWNLSSWQACDILRRFESTRQYWDHIGTDVGDNFTILEVSLQFESSIGFILGTHSAELNQR